MQKGYPLSCLKFCYVYKCFFLTPHYVCVSDFPVPYITHVDIVEAGLDSLESEVLSVATTIESARFMNNKISHIQDDAFR